MNAGAKLGVVLGAMVALALVTSDTAVADFKYKCGQHRNAQCHQEPRGDQFCASQNNNCYGRCGPACNWTILGNAYTNACANHDSCVRTRLCDGNSGWNAHSSCAGSLPAAVGSFIQSHWNYGFQHARDTWSGLWKKVKNCCN